MSEEVGWAGAGRTAENAPVVAGSPGAALGADPFDGLDAEPDPFLEALELMGGGARVPLAIAPPNLETSAPARDPGAPTPLQRRRWATTPTLEEVDMPDATGVIDRLLSQEIG